MLPRLTNVVEAGRLRPARRAGRPSVFHRPKYTRHVLRNDCGMPVPFPRCYNRRQGESTEHGEPFQYCGSVEEGARPSTTAVVRIECGPRRVCRSVQQSWKQTCAGGEKKTSPHERQGPGCNPPRTKSPVGKGQGGKEIICSYHYLHPGCGSRPSLLGWMGGAPVVHLRDPARLARCAA
jgi:hypothetical protein